MLQETKEGVILPVKVTPKAKMNQIAGWENGLLKIKVTAAAEKGEANLAVVQLLSKMLKLPQKNIILLRGATSRTKQFCLTGISLDDANNLLHI